MRIIRERNVEITGNYYMQLKGEGYGDQTVGIFS